MSKKITAARSLNPRVAAGTDVIPGAVIGDPTDYGLIAQDIANLAPIGAGLVGGVRVGAALTGNGSTDVVATLQASVNATPAGSTWVLDPGTAGGAHRISTTLVIPRGINVDMSMAELVATFTDRPMVTVGDVANENSYRRLCIRVRGTMSSGTFAANVNTENVGVRFHNIRDSEVQLWTERTYIGHEYVSQQTFGVTGLRTVVHRSVDHKNHFRGVCKGGSADPLATPGSNETGEYLNGNTWYFGRMDNSSGIGAADSIGIRMDGTHGGYNRCHGNVWWISQHQLQNHATAKRKLISFGPGQPAASHNHVKLNYYESGNGAIGEFDPSASQNTGNTIEVTDWIPGSPANMILDWTGGASGYGGLNWVYPPKYGASGEQHVGRDRKPSWSSGRLVDMVSYYNDGAITLDGKVFHKISSDNMQTYQPKPLTANINPGWNVLRVVTGGLFVWLNTENTKKFTIWRDCIPGFGGRVLLAPADVNKNLLTGGADLRAGPNMSLNAGSSWVGAANSYYQGSADTDLPIIVTVSSTCKWLLVGIVSGSNPAVIREMHITSLDDVSRAPIHVAGADDFGSRKTLVAAKRPAISTGATLFGYGRYRRGDVILNDGSSIARGTEKQYVASQDQLLAPTWQASQIVALDVLRTGIGGAVANVYRCTGAGTTAASIGPTGTSKTTPVVDGTAQWLYAGPAWAAWLVEV